jgi:GDP-mannose 6-dehydrogenase
MNVPLANECIPPSNIAVLGLGYVGCVTAACLSALGHRVTGLDRDTAKVETVSAGRAPFYEPGLEELVAEGVRSGRLTASVLLRQAIREADIAIICVGTPSERGGNQNLEQLRRVAEEIALELPGRAAAGMPPLIVVVRSTVFPGTCEEVVAPLLGDGADIVSNPEFLREGTAVKDFMEPSLLVVGGSDAEAAGRVAALYSPLDVAVHCVALRTAEMIKFACNAFHAVKIAFANEMGAVCAPLGIDAGEVMRTLCEDRKLNVSPAYLQPGFAFGGSCLPKDVRALTYRGLRLEVKLPLMESVLPSNQCHLARDIEHVLQLPGRLGIFGLAFKENTDDLRESPVVTLVEQLIGKGRDIRVFDPHIRLNRIYGTNRSFLLRAVPHIEKLMLDTLDELLGWSGHLILAQKPAGNVLDRITQSGIPVADLVGTSRPYTFNRPGAS